MPRSNRELWLAGLAALLITIVYLLVAVNLGSIPAASDFFGHSIGILGFILMVMTETLYTMRKRSRSARWGRMATWLQFHIFTGLVGPYMVLLHSSWKFNGLAGVLMLLTVIIVLSGVIGRYIYTSVPRTADGIALEASELEHQIASVDTALQRALGTPAGSALARALAPVMVTEGGQGEVSLVFGRAFTDLRQRLQWRQVKRQLDPQLKDQVKQLESLLRQKRNLQRQIGSLAAARRLLGLWHAVHIPIGMALFAVAAVHIVAALYYATLLR